MHNINFKPNNSINKLRTSIGVRLWTKNRLLDHSKPGESLDDTIARVLNTYDRQAEIIERLESIISTNNIKEPNYIGLQKDIRINDVVTTESGLNIYFSYKKPILEFPDIEHYHMDVVLSKADQKGKKKKFEDLGFSIDDWMLVRFKIIEKIINTHFDPSFQLPEKTSVFNLLYWSKVCSRVGLPNNSFERDILTIISDYERCGEGENSSANFNGPA